MSKNPITYYPHKEEIFNVVSHGLGFLFSIAGLVLLVVFAALDGSAWHAVSYSIFGASMVVLYLASTLYHLAKERSLRKKLNVFDHAAIYVLIAGTYTPYCLVTLNGWVGWTLFGTTWGLAIAGIILKLFFTGRYDKASTIGYVLMGWVAIIAAKPIYENMTGLALTFLLIGGVSYTIGAVFYMMKRLPYNHAIFHLWVLGGTCMHFFSVFYLL